MATISDNLQTLQNTLTDIKTALTNKGVSPSDALVDVPDEIDAIQTGQSPVLETLNVTVNGQYTPGVGVDGYDEVNVNVSQNITTYTVYIAWKNAAGTKYYLPGNSTSKDGREVYDYNNTDPQGASRSNQYRPFIVDKNAVVIPKDVPNTTTIYESTNGGTTFNITFIAGLSVDGDPWAQMVQVTQDNQQIEFIMQE